MVGDSTIRSMAGTAIAEIAIIIVGVLLAFQVENWRVDRDTREQEAAQLMALHADFLRNSSRLEEVIALQEGVVRAQSRLLKIAYQIDPRPAGDELVQVITTAQSFYRLKAVMGAYQSLVS
jgi:Tfp pilus assembly protein PilE